MLQGKYDEAEPLAREAVAIYRKVHGDEHPLLASGLNTLAGLLREKVSQGSLFLSPPPNAVFEDADLVLIVVGQVRRGRAALS